MCLEQKLSWRGEVFYMNLETVILILEFVSPLMISIIIHKLFKLNWPSSFSKYISIITMTGIAQLSFIVSIYLTHSVNFLLNGRWYLYNQNYEIIHFTVLLLTT